MSRRRVAVCGMTLIELLFVMAVIALVLGVGLGAVASLDLGRGTAAPLVRSVLRAAQNWAVAERAPARVRIDRAGGRLLAEGLAVVGTWEFESDPPRGAFGLDGDLDGLRIVEGGFLGRCLSLSDAPAGSSFRVPVEEDPSFDLSQGFRLRMALRPEDGRGGRLLRIGGVFAVDVTAGGGLLAAFAAQRVDEDGIRRSAGKAQLRAPAGPLRPGRWNRVLIAYDRRLFGVWVEGVRVAGLFEDAPLAAVDGPLVVGGGSGNLWRGRLDSLVVSAVATEDAVELPEGVTFTPKTPDQVVFAAGGGLDRTVHDAPVEVGLVLGDGTQRTVRVGWYGTVE